ncbi:MAG: hypothetical protein JSW63_04290 [Ignavibacterium sp.]|nr:MAG: hypothetical protein JSW63_04290 [Ignavibacterium sp.]
MLKYGAILILAVAIIISCDQFSETTLPDHSSPTPQVNLISIPVPDGGLSVEGLLTRYKKIEGDDGGKFTANFTYSGGPFGTVTVTSTLDFEEDAFDEDDEVVIS